MGEEASEIMDRWTWSGDDAQAVPALLAMPTAHELTEAVLRQCVRNNSLTPATAALVQKYATRHVADDKLRDRVLRVCVLALRYLPSHAVAVLEAIYRFDDFDRQDVAEACVACTAPSFPLNVRTLAMHVVACMTSRYCCDALRASFADVCDLVTQESVTAPALLARAAGDDVDLIRRAIACCVLAGNCTRPAVDMALDVADEQPALAVDIGAIQIILKAGHELPDNVMAACRATRPVASRHELLVYLAKFGVVPPGAERIWAYVLGSCTIKTKVLYVRYLDERAQLEMPPVSLPPFCEKHTGCVRLVPADGEGVPVLLSMLARHASMFDRAHAWGQTDTFHVQCSQDTAEKLRDVVYYYALVDMSDWDVDDARGVVGLADMIGARAVLYLVLHRMATLDFWAAWDMTHEWFDTAPVLRRAAVQQLPMLVRCSRMHEIAALVAGCQ